MDEVGFPVGCGNDATDRPDEHAVVLDVGLLRESVANVEQVGDDWYVGFEAPRRLGQQARGKRCQHHDNRHSEAEQLPVGWAAPVQFKGIGHLSPTSPQPSHRT